MKAFFKRLFCRHKSGVWRVLAIAFDGETTIQCPQCGKIKRVPL